MISLLRRAKALAPAAHSFAGGVTLSRSGSPRRIFARTPSVEALEHRLLLSIGAIDDQAQLLTQPYAEVAAPSCNCASNCVASDASRTNSTA